MHHIILTGGYTLNTLRMLCENSSAEKGTVVSRCRRITLAEDANVRFTKVDFPEPRGPFTTSVREGDEEAFASKAAWKGLRGRKSSASSRSTVALFMAVTVRLTHQKLLSFQKEYAMGAQRVSTSPPSVVNTFLGVFPVAEEA